MNIKIDNKGFTLIELLATVAILALVMGIASTSVISSINASKNKSEKIFTQKVSNLIDDYLNLYGSTLSVKKIITTTYQKCEDKSCQSSYQVTVNQLTSIHLQDLVDKNLIESEKLINPSNKEKCLNGTNNPEIKIYKDSDNVYYYQADLSEASCGLKQENSLINTLPTTLQSLIN